MISRARPIIALALLIALVTAAGAAPLTVAAQGNSGNARACQNGGWQWMVREDGATFRNTGDCVSYGAHGGAYGTPPHVEFHFTDDDGQRCWLDWTLVDGRPGDVVQVNTVLLMTTYGFDDTFSARVSTDTPQAPRDERVTFEYVYVDSTAYVEGSGLLVAVINTGSAQCNR